MASEAGIAPTSRLFQSRANLPQLLGEMVVPAGNAPASSGYQPGALLLSYGTIVNCGFAPNRFEGQNVKFIFIPGRIRITRFGL
jgi:hypothetical protein